MTLDPVHFDGIARLAGRIHSNVDVSDHRAFAETVWEEFLDPLWSEEGVKLLEPVGEHRRRKINVETAALQEDAFPTRHGLDSGTINPTTFDNGLVLDVAQAAMAAVPSDLELHRARTVVATVHSNDVTVDCTEEDWSMFDGGYSQGRVVQAPRVSRYAEAVVHALSLYLAESQHALTESDMVEDLLILDGPIYPKGLLQWDDRHPELADLLMEDERPRDVLANYLRLVEQFAERDVPLVGFVKTPTTAAITRTVRQKGSAPWVDDAAFFAKILERRERVTQNLASSPRSDGEKNNGFERAKECLTFTGWFRSRCGVDHPFSVNGGALGIERRRPEADYEVTFFIVYDPRDDLVYRIEAPYVFTQSPETREAIARQIVKGIALGGGPPPAVAKADELARISADEKGALGRKIEETFDAERSRTYDDQRWGLLDER